MRSRSSTSSTKRLSPSSQTGGVELVGDDPLVEERGLPAGVIEIAIYLIDRLGGALLDEQLLKIRDAVAKTLKGKRPHGGGSIRIVTVYGPDGETLAEIEVRPDTEAAKD